MIERKKKIKKSFKKGSKKISLGIVCETHLFHWINLNIIYRSQNSRFPAKCEIFICRANQVTPKCTTFISQVNMVQYDQFSNFGEKVCSTYFRLDHWNRKSFFTSFDGERSLST